MYVDVGNELPLSHLAAPPSPSQQAVFCGPPGLRRHGGGGSPSRSRMHTLSALPPPSPPLSHPPPPPARNTSTYTGS